MPRRRRHPTSPPATPLDDDDLLAEFLLRLPPKPSSLPRAAAVCKTWRRIVTDPHFLRRFRAHHRNPPLLGFFDRYGRFFPTPKAPDRVPAARLSVSTVGLKLKAWKVVACRDGLVLCRQGLKLQVLDPMTGDRSAILTREDELPELLAVELIVDSTRVERLCFRLVALSTDADWTKLSASVYSSNSGAWAHTVETLVSQYTYRFRHCHSTLVGNTIYWSHVDAIEWPYTHGRILQYDLETQTLAIMDIETPLTDEECYAHMVLIMTKDGLVSIAILEEDRLIIQLWVRETIHCGAAKWVLRKTIRPDTLFPLPLEQNKHCRLLETDVVGFEEVNNVVYLTIHIGLFMFNLESMEFTRVSEERNFYYIYPYSSFVTAGFDEARE